MTNSTTPTDEQVREILERPYTVAHTVIRSDGGPVPTSREIVDMTRRERDALCNALLEAREQIEYREQTILAANKHIQGYVAENKILQKQIAALLPAARAGCGALAAGTRYAFISDEDYHAAKAAVAELEKADD